MQVWPIRLHSVRPECKHVDIGQPTKLITIAKHNQYKKRGYSATKEVTVRVNLENSDMSGVS